MKTVHGAEFYANKKHKGTLDENSSGANGGLNEYGSSSTSTGSSRSEGGLLKGAQKFGSGFSCKTEWNGLGGERRDDHDDDENSNGRNGGDGRMNYKKNGARPKARDSGSGGGISRNKDSNGEPMSEAMLDVKGVFITPDEMDPLSFLMNNSGGTVTAGAVSASGVEFLEKIIKTEALDDFLMLDELNEGEKDHQDSNYGTMSNCNTVATVGPNNFYENPMNSSMMPSANNNPFGLAGKRGVVTTTMTTTRAVAMPNPNQPTEFLNFVTTSSTTSSTNSASSIFLNYKKILVLGNSKPSIKTSNKNGRSSANQCLNPVNPDCLQPPRFTTTTTTTTTLVHLDNCDDQLMLSINSLKSIKLDDDDHQQPVFPPNSMPTPNNGNSNHNMNYPQTFLKTDTQTAPQYGTLQPPAMAQDRRDSNQSTVSSYYCSMRSDQENAARRRSSELSTISEFRQMGNGINLPVNPFQTIGERENYYCNNNDGSFYDPISPGSSRRSSSVVATNNQQNNTQMQYPQCQMIKGYWNEGEIVSYPMETPPPPPNYYQNNIQQQNSNPPPNYPTKSVSQQQPVPQPQVQQSPVQPANTSGPHHPNEEVVLDEFDENEMIENKLVLPDDMLNYLQAVTNSPNPLMSPPKEIQCQDISQSSPRHMAPATTSTNPPTVTTHYNPAIPGPSAAAPNVGSSMKDDVYRRTLEYVQNCQTFLQGSEQPNHPQMQSNNTTTQNMGNNANNNTNW